MTWNGRHGKGAMRAHREAKRREAQARNAETAHEDTRAHRLGRCGVNH